MKTTITLQNSTIFIVIEEEQVEKTTLKIRNDVPDINLRVYQEGTNPLDGNVVKSGAIIPWSWELPSQKKVISVDFGFEDTESYLPSGQSFKFDTLNRVQRIQIPSIQKDKSSKIYNVVSMEGNARVLTFFAPVKRRNNRKYSSLKDLDENKAQKNNTTSFYNLNLEVNLRAVGISVISGIKNKKKKKKERKEVMYLVLRGLEFKLLDSIESSTFQLRMKYLNLDNNIIYDTSFPVALTPSKPALLGPDTRNYFLDVLISQRKTPEVKFIFILGPN